MEKDQMKTNVKSKRTRLSGDARQDRIERETGYPSGTHDPNLSEAEVRKTRRPYREAGSNDPSGNTSSLKGILGAAGLLAGGALLFRAAKGTWPFSKKARSIELQTKQTIKRSRRELYAYWRNLENLPNFMSHIKDIREIDEMRSQWTAEIPGGIGTIEWEAVIEQDIENEYISWSSIADADIENAGEVRFKDAPSGKGTIVETTISYRPPSGKVGEYAAKLLNPAFEKIVKNDLKQFKKYMEKGGERKWRSEPEGDVLY
ncbi:SRPBCC family protein [Salinimicrobium xinjiangense]|uniref:SRPBCC family protein n=1 Tax=Salinimicrobium xinjiangense TaxID=438596 RepID=UPI0004164B0E|nr:SRPBCC family protein [Salinimicrobium xinjiangense]